ncbi:MAG: DUF853 family protein [Candidatus Thorarchaeota archaeon]|nr:DUF853 family protein [Candidatus Thorarchaeota archaeon]
MTDGEERTGTVHSRGQRFDLQMVPRICWLLVLACTGVYYVTAYLLPLGGMLAPPAYGFKYSFEVIIVVVLCVVSMLNAAISNRAHDTRTEVQDDIVYFHLGSKFFGTTALELTSVSSSVQYETDAPPHYNTSMLLAMRSGMTKGTVTTYEVGVSGGEPFVRLLISAKSSSMDEIRETLRREAMRLEAVLVASLASVEISQIRGESLKQVISEHLIDDEGGAVRGSTGAQAEGTLLIILKGVPRVTPAVNRSQIGALLSSLLKQGCEARFSCTFSSADSRREKRRLEGEWRAIRDKEKKKNDSLGDQTRKQHLLDRYQTIQNEEGWFDVSSYMIVSTREASMGGVQDGAIGLALSIWGGNGLKIATCTKLSEALKYRMLTRRHLKPQKLYADALAAYVNTPNEQIPVVSSTPPPTFPIPHKSLVDNEIHVGWTVYGNRLLNPVGLKPEWLREHVAVLGATGTGKTTLVKRIIAELSTKTNVPWWIFDVKGSEYTELATVGADDVLVLRPGIDPAFTIDLVDAEVDTPQSTFTILRELIRERNTSSDLSPAMERLLKEAVMDMVERGKGSGSAEALVESVRRLSEEDRIGVMTRDALLNRLEVISGEPLGRVLRGGQDAVKISSLLGKRVIFDLRHIARSGGMEAARLLYNLVAKRIFDAGMKRGISPGLRHVVVLEEASNLIPESYTRSTAADVTTGESMVMLQRATGQGVIVVSTRPNVSSNVLANTATKFVFRLPYDSSLGAKLLSIDEHQERHLRSLRVGRALASIPSLEAFEVSTEPFNVEQYQVEAPRLPSERLQEEAIISRFDSQAYEEESPESDLGVKDEDREGKVSCASESHASPQDSMTSMVVPEGATEIRNHIAALLASKTYATVSEIRRMLSAVDSFTDDDFAALVHEMVSKGSIVREAIPLVEGGFVYALPGNGHRAVKRVIMDYILEGLGGCFEVQEKELEDGCSQLLVDDHAIIVFPEHLKTTSMDDTVERIRGHMSRFGNETAGLIVIVRGSVAAAKLRELMDKSDQFDAVEVISVFPSSLDKAVQDLVQRAGRASVARQEETEDSCVAREEIDTDAPSQIQSYCEVEPTRPGSVQLRLWAGLLQDFVELRGGQVRWAEALEFIETTARQSSLPRALPLSRNSGESALKRLLADEVLVAIRAGEDRRLISLDEGLWVVNGPTLTSLRESVVQALQDELKHKHGPVWRNHDEYDLCSGGVSYIVFPTQHQLNMVMRIGKGEHCRKCHSRKTVCVLTAAEYGGDDAVATPELLLRTVEEGLSAVVL